MSERVFRDLHRFRAILLCPNRSWMAAIRKVRRCSSELRANSRMADHPPAILSMSALACTRQLIFGRTEFAEPWPTFRDPSPQSS